MIRPAPQPQARAFDRAMATRLGLNPSEVADSVRFGFTVVGGEEYAQVDASLTAYLPAAEVLEMWNEAASAGDES